MTRPAALLCGRVPYEINGQEFEAILALEGPKRYEHFIKRCADWREVWTLGDEQVWASAVDDDGKGLFFVWPHPRYAEACADGDWERYGPVCIELDEWFEEILPQLLEEQLLVGVLRDSGGTAVQVPPERLAQDLRDELTLYE